MLWGGSGVTNDPTCPHCIDKHGQPGAKLNVRHVLGGLQKRRMFRHNVATIETSYVRNDPFVKERLINILPRATAAATAAPDVYALSEI